MLGGGCAKYKRKHRCHGGDFDGDSRGIVSLASRGGDNGDFRGGDNGDSRRGVRGVASLPSITDPDNSFATMTEEDKEKVRNSIAYTGNNPFNLTIGGGDWRGARDSRSAVGHTFETFDSPVLGFRAGFLNHIRHNDRNIEAGRENSIYTLLEEATPYEQNKEFWDGGGAERLAEKIGIGLRQNIDLNNQRHGRAFARAVANMEIGSRGDPWGIYDDALDIVYRERGQRVPDRRSRATAATN